MRMNAATNNPKQFYMIMITIQIDKDLSIR